jgi:ribosome modulation factor
MAEQALEPFDEREREDQDLADYDIGMQAGLEGKSFDAKQTQPWKDGWADAQKE